MNSAYLKRQRQQERASAAMGVLGALILALLAAAFLTALVKAGMALPTAWWLPVDQRPFGGAL